MSAVNAAIKIPLVFFTFMQLVYMAIVYNVVSVDPIIVDAIIPSMVSTPQFFIMSVAIAIDPLPDTGLSNASGINSPGKFIRFSIGLAMCVIHSNIPDDLNAPIATNSPISVGNILNVVSIPSFAPTRNVSKTLFFSLAHMLLLAE